MRNAETRGSSSSQAWTWPATLALVTILGTLASACMTPYIALAVVAAATMSRRHAVCTIGGVWLTAQMLGFTMLHYPTSAYAFAWGAALGIAALAAMSAASRIVGRDRPSLSRLLAAFALSFVVYEGLLLGFAYVAGGLETFAPSVVLQIASNDGVWLAVLAMLHMVLTSSAPRWFGPAPAPRLA